VKDKDIGPLVSTDMTRCIHCTRCVRFGRKSPASRSSARSAAASTYEIGTYVEQSVDHELSGNIIDLCPVGALNNKPYRLPCPRLGDDAACRWCRRMMVSARTCTDTCCAGERDARRAAKANEAINETWIADRDRFSYEGIYRAGGPKVQTLQVLLWPACFHTGLQAERQVPAVVAISRR
jgi:NADH-quinone oxidoreductase subunit G